MNILTYPTKLSDNRIVIHAIAEGDPLSKQRPRFALNKGGSVYTPTSTKDAEEYIGWVVKSSKPSLFCDKENLFGIRLIFHQANCQRRDIDNMVKLVLDGCTGIVWDDDSQVIELNAYKYINVGKDNAKTEICIYKATNQILQQSFDTCVYCGKRYRTHPSWKVIGKLYCSRDCLKADRELKAIKKVCIYCGVEYRCLPGRANTRKYCSQACRIKAKAKKQS